MLLIVCDGDGLRRGEVGARVAGFLQVAWGVVSLPHTVELDAGVFCVYDFVICVVVLGEGYLVGHEEDAGVLPGALASIRDDPHFRRKAVLTRYESGPPRYITTAGSNTREPYSLCLRIGITRLLGRV